MMSQQLLALVQQRDQGKFNVDEIVHDLFETVEQLANPLLQSIVVLALGYAIARFAKGRAYDFAANLGFDQRITGTPLEKMANTRDSAAYTTGLLVYYYVMLVAVSIAVNLLSIGQQAGVESLINTGVRYGPIFLFGLFFIGAGIVVATGVSRHVRQTDMARLLPRGVLAEVLSGIVAVFTIVIGLDILGVTNNFLGSIMQSLNSLFRFGNTLFLIVGIAVAIGMGIALSQPLSDRLRDYVEE